MIPRLARDHMFKTAYKALHDSDPPKSLLHVPFVNEAVTLSEGAIKQLLLIPDVHAASAVSPSNPGENELRVLLYIENGAVDASVASSHHALQFGYCFLSALRRYAEIDVTVVDFNDVNASVVDSSQINGSNTCYKLKTSTLSYDTLFSKFSTSASPFMLTVTLAPALKLIPSLFNAQDVEHTNHISILSCLQNSTLQLRYFVTAHSDRTPEAFVFFLYFLKLGGGSSDSVQVTTAGDTVSLTHRGDWVKLSFEDLSTSCIVFPGGAALLVLSLKSGTSGVPRTGTGDVRMFSIHHLRLLLYQVAPKEKRQPSPPLSSIGDGVGDGSSVPSLNPMHIASGGLLLDELGTAVGDGSSVGDGGGGSSSGCQAGGYAHLVPSIPFMNPFPQQQQQQQLQQGDEYAVVVHGVEADGASSSNSHDSACSAPHAMAGAETRSGGGTALTSEEKVEGGANITAIVGDSLGLRSEKAGDVDEGELERSAGSDGFYEPTWKDSGHQWIGQPVLRRFREKLVLGKITAWAPAEEDFEGEELWRNQHVDDEIEYLDAHEVTAAMDLLHTLSPLGEYLSVPVFSFVSAEGIETHAGLPVSSRLRYLSDVVPAQRHRSSASASASAITTDSFTSPHAHHVDIGTVSTVLPVHNGRLGKVFEYSAPGVHMCRL